MRQRDYGTAGASQCSIILRMLRRRKTWVPMPALAKASGAYAVNSRVAELRKRGHVVETRIVRTGRVVRSSYRLVEGAR